MDGPAGAHGGGHPDHGEHGSATEGSAGTGAESAVGGAALGPDAPAFGGADPGGGVGGGEAESGSIAAFRSAIAKALGVQELSGGVGTLGSPQAQPGSPALEAHDMDTDAVRNALEAAGMFDDPSNVDPADDFDAELAYGTGATVAQDTHDADLALHTGATSLGTLGPHYGYDAVEEQVYGGKKSAFEQDVNKSVNIGIESEYDSHMNSLVSAVELEYENIMNNTAPFSKERNKALRELNAIKDTALYSKAYNVSNPSAVRNMIAKAMGFFGMGTAFSLAQALENKAIERGLFDRTTFDQMMKEFDDPAAFGAAGNPLGTGGSDENKQKKIIMELFYQTNPWARGLNQRQIDYYLDRPSELEWVQNLYNQMNPSEDVTDQSGAGAFANDVIQTQMDGFKQTGIVWKPQSEADNNLVILTPPGFDSANVSIENEAGDVLDTGRNMGRTNGRRFTYRFSRPGAQYQGPIYLRIGNTRYKIDNPGARVN